MAGDEVDGLAGTSGRGGKLLPRDLEYVGLTMSEPPLRPDGWPSRSLVTLEETYGDIAGPVPWSEAAVEPLQ
jgi:hypothetical protein